MRIGKTVEHLKAAAVALRDRSSKNDILRYLGVIRQLGYGGYLTLDIASWANLATDIVAGLYKLHINLASAKELASEEKTGPTNIKIRRLQNDQTAIFYQLIQDFLDITIPGSALDYFKLDDGLVGLAGVISSFMGARTQWKKVAAKDKAA
ncbi:Peroxisomal biogenesis factor 11 [Neolecta irregularis DAH-3]|uniref:Peroxisomal biogenesis factor 11 n=1 Tax=Neolecta irregularis (strain DAH-3) TaxID=1198029 RepID=A0A1U7LVU2_NEOID|nr:Peroxisomal biogenesis factor 11 [Neolecta irregularis DAH-3]|eukprot:OLL26795.1 Peroxisomal biogenesis factor 11 [Neolecta irregularis DAH-3]